LPDYRKGKLDENQGRKVLDLKSSYDYGGQDCQTAEKGKLSGS
jgi:hypothetical protein